MNVFCDTSVLIAASLEAHQMHERARLVLERIKNREDIGHCSAHSLAETFSVLARMPTSPKLQPSDVLAILERNVFPTFVVIGLEPTDYMEVIRTIAGLGLSGGRIYDLLHLQAAKKLILDRIYTFNLTEWKLLAPDVAGLIAEPPEKGT